MEFISNDLNDIYKQICRHLLLTGHKNNNTIEIPCINFKLNDINNCIITNKGKKPSIKYLLAENIWYANGCNKLDFINKYAKYWNEISDDGETCNSAYGYIIKRKFGFNQILKVIELLDKDKSSRRACIIINDANENVDITKDEQCTMYLQFLIRDNQLNLIVNMRSNDLIYGLPYDVPAFITIQKFIAGVMGLKCGWYYHHAGSMHFYDKDKNTIMKIVRSENDKHRFKYNLEYIYDMPYCFYQVAKNNPDELIDFAIKMKVLEEI